MKIYTSYPSKIWWKQQYISKSASTQPNLPSINISPACGLILAFRADYVVWYWFCHVLFLYVLSSPRKKNLSNLDLLLQKKLGLWRRNLLPNLSPKAIDFKLIPLELKISGIATLQHVLSRLFFKISITSMIEFLFHNKTRQVLALVSELFLKYPKQA